MITQMEERHDGGETVDSETETQRKNDIRPANKTQQHSKLNSNEETERFGDNVTANPSVDHLSMQRVSVEKSIRTTGMSSKKLEKTMLKVMDPNVHQMVLNVDEVNQNSNSDEDYVPSETDPVQKHQQILNGVISAPKLEMQRKIGRQSELIRSLEQSEAARSSEIIELKQKLAEKDDEIEHMRDSIHDSLSSVKLFDNRQA